MLCPPHPHFPHPQTIGLIKGFFVWEDCTYLEELEERFKAHAGSSADAGGGSGAGGDVQEGAAAGRDQDKAAGKEGVVGAAAAAAAAAKQVDAGRVAAGKEAVEPVEPVAGSSSSAAAAAAEGDATGGAAQEGPLTDAEFTQQVQAVIAKRMGQIESDIVGLMANLSDSQWTQVVEHTLLPQGTASWQSLIDKLQAQSGKHSS